MYDVHATDANARADVDVVTATVYDITRGLRYTGPRMLSAVAGAGPSFGADIDALLEDIEEHTRDPDEAPAGSLPCVSDCVTKATEQPAQPPVVTTLAKQSDYVTLPSYADVAIVGAGPAGLGVAAALQAVGIADVVVLEQSSAGVGATMRTRWPSDMHMVTPSFYANPFLNVRAHDVALRLWIPAAVRFSGVRRGELWFD